ncbi:PadR family transcriptional regulator [Gordonia sp. ABSL11-1]|uniref:PadR family transcriptional regulator n=1 Tax=Gordonia sp. ABSL11-1 TaxID=3053924 RepID=UPI002572B2FB|nr:PadR family transcriptional regulator [Gordonia sp. ABSL11-1]MDL9945737.1 PadR family transcriptional regulator [Gordonia sp. ABSL11-1]
MASNTTRLLLLGTVALFEPVNGYQIRRELMSWQVDRWANVNPGSIYHGLGSLVSSGLAVRHDLADGARDVAVYELTDDGHTEFRRLLTDAIVTVNVFDRRDFHAAFGLLPLLEPEAAIELLDRRHAALAAAVTEVPVDTDPADHPHVPPHAIRGMALWGAEARAELGWLADVVDDLRSGRLDITSNGWTPPADDPGHQMTADRERYRAMIALRQGRQEATSQ